jgi:hypothetical protein
LLAEKREVPEELLQAHDAGTRITERMVKEALTAPKPRKLKRAS